MTTPLRRQKKLNNLVRKLTDSKPLAKIAAEPASPAGAKRQCPYCVQDAKSFLEYCGEYMGEPPYPISGYYSCTRKAGHEGPHVACSGNVRHDYLHTA